MDRRLNYVLQGFALPLFGPKSTIFSVPRVVTSVSGGSRPTVRGGRFKREAER
jgi:hypothetical protein